MTKRTHAHAALQEHKESDSIRKRQKTLEERVRELEKEIKASPQEKEAFSGPTNALGTDVLALNVGGTKFDVLRSTLTSVEGSMLAAKFSGRWEDSLERDAEGRVFLEANPEYFWIVLDQLRSKMWDTRRLHSNTVPCIQDFGSRRKFEQFFRLVEYFGLTDTIFPPVIRPVSSVDDTVSLSVTHTARGVELTSSESMWVEISSSCNDLIVAEASLQIPDEPAVNGILTLASGKDEANLIIYKLVGQGRKERLSKVCRNNIDDIQHTELPDDTPLIVEMNSIKGVHTILGEELDYFEKKPYSTLFSFRDNVLISRIEYDIVQST